MLPLESVNGEAREGGVSLPISESAKHSRAAAAPRASLHPDLTAVAEILDGGYEWCKADLDRPRRGRRTCDRISLTGAHGRYGSACIRLANMAS